MNENSIVRIGLSRIKQTCLNCQWHNWLSTDSTLVIHGIWFAAMILLLAGLDHSRQVVWLVPPFSATLSILLLLPKSPIAQPIPVVLGATLAAGAGTTVSLLVHGPVYAALVALVVVMILPRLRIYHPPAVALSMYPLLLHTGLLFPVVVVLPFTLVSVVSCSILSRLFRSWGTYPLPLH